MSTSYDLTIASVVTLIAIIMHRISIELFQPGSPLYKVATDGTEVMNGQAIADMWFQIFAIWAPLLVVGGVWTWTLFKVYRRQAITARQPV